VHMYFVKWVSSSKPMKPYSADWYLWTSDSRSQYPNSNTEPCLKYHAFSLALHSQTLRGNFSKLRWISERFNSGNVRRKSKALLPGVSTHWIKASHNKASHLPPPAAPPYNATPAGQEWNTRWRSVGTYTVERSNPFARIIQASAASARRPG